jgi:hypothetical protein
MEENEIDFSLNLEEEILKVNDELNRLFLAFL